MRIIRKGRVYDTETAQIIGITYPYGYQHYKGTYHSDYYIKKNGEVFLRANNRIITDVDVNDYEKNDMVENMIDDINSVSKIIKEDEHFYPTDYWNVPIFEIHNQKLFEKVKQMYNQRCLN